MKVSEDSYTEAWNYMCYLCYAIGHGPLVCDKNGELIRVGPYASMEGRRYGFLALIGGLILIFAQIGMKSLNSSVGSYRSPGCAVGTILGIWIYLSLDKRVQCNVRDSEHRSIEFIDSVDVKETRHRVITLLLTYILLSALMWIFILVDVLGSEAIADDYMQNCWYIVWFVAVYCTLECKPITRLRALKKIRWENG